MFTVKNYGVSFSTKKSDIALTNFFVSLVGADIDFPIRTDSARKIIIDQDEKYIYGTVITMAVAGAECNTVIELTLEHHAA